MDQGDKAFVTVATDNNYAMGALVLGHSLRQVQTKYKLVAFITPEVSSSLRSKLSVVFDELREVNILDSNDEVNLSLMQRPELGKTFTKLHIWKLVGYSKCVFLDADTLVTKNCDELFEKDELSAAPDIGWPDCFNSGVFVFIPSMETFQNLLKMSVEKGSFDGGDQGLLNTYFNSWNTEDIAKHLSFIYNMVISSSYTYVPAYKHYGHNVKIIHFLGSIKPWMHDHRKSLGAFQPCENCVQFLEHLLLWWDIYTKNVADLSPEDEANVCEEMKDLLIGQEVESSEASPSAELPPRNRQASWEQGQIDYLGEDSFDHIQRKLDEVIRNGSNEK